MAGLGFNAQKTLDAITSIFGAREQRKLEQAKASQNTTLVNTLLASSQQTTRILMFSAVGLTFFALARMLKK